MDTHEELIKSSIEYNIYSKIRQFGIIGGVVILAGLLFYTKIYQTVRFGIDFETIFMYVFLALFWGSIVFSIMSSLIKKRKVDYLKQQGSYLLADIIEAKEHTAKQGSRYTIICRATHPVLGRPVLFESTLLASNPLNNGVEYKQCVVYYDMSDPTYYWVDTTQFK